jgi:hypothetical protein
LFCKPRFPLQRGARQKASHRVSASIVGAGNSIWVKTYHGYGDTMEPYEDNNPEESWNNCSTGQDCFQIHEGNIYKCSPLAYLPMQKNKINLSSKWDFYLSYKPLTPDSTDQEVAEFFSRGAEAYCGMCPAAPMHFKKPNPLTSRKKFLIKKYND